MILVDANLLLYAYVPSLPHHSAARPWLETTFGGTEPVRLSWVTLLAFMRIGTDSRAFARPLSAVEAGVIVSEWLALPAVGIIEPGEGHWDILSRFMADNQVSGPLVMDAHLAALAIEHGATLYTTDQDFSRFPGLRVVNPLKKAE